MLIKKKKKCVVKKTERRKNQSEEWTYFNLLFIYFVTVNKYGFCISGT